MTLFSAGLQRARIERWRAAKSSITAALLALDPVEDETQITLLRATAASLDAKIKAAGGDP